jgi:hypothetical protein
MSLETKLNLLHDEVLPLKRDHQKILEHLTNIDRQLTEIWSKIIQMQFDIARIRAGIPGRVYVDYYGVDNDEAKKLSDDIDKLNSTTQAPTKAKHGARCHECNPGWDERLNDG